MEISMPKQEIANIIKSIEVDGLKIEKYYKKPITFSTLPAITYSQNLDSIHNGFNQTIQKENYGFQIDVWGKKSSDISKIVRELKKQCILNRYIVVNGNDIEDPSDLYRYVLIVERRK